MKRFLFVFILLPLACISQQQSFDLTRYTPPAGWKKQASDNALQLSTENTKDGSYCLITLFKSIPGTANAKENFEAAWESVVMEMVKIKGKPEMQPPATENGWEALSGYAPFENEGQQGLALLVTSTGYSKMVNILILTNTTAYQDQMNTFLESVSLSIPKGNTNATGKTQTGSGIGNSINKTNEPVSTNTVRKDGFAFSTTNFDDGWTSTVQEDWVEVTRGNFRVLLHYPKDGTITQTDPEPHVITAWNILVAPRYSNLKNFKTSYINTYSRPYLGMGNLVENKSGKEKFVVLFRQGSTGWIEISCPDKNSFIQQFRFDPTLIRWDSETSLLDPLSQLVNYNKFAVAASDFRGTWTSDFTGVQQLYHVYTGQYAGMNVNQSSQTFQFMSGNSYNWKIIAVNGMVGNMRYDNAKSSGKFTVPNNWQIRFSSIEGKPKLYHAFFSCIKGARLLNLLDAEYPGNGVYTSFGIQK